MQSRIWRSTKPKLLPPCCAPRLIPIQEFRVTVTNPNASQGRSSGGQVSLITKSGTNELHGSLYEFHRNTATSANDFFNNRTIDPDTGQSIPRPKLIRNLFGGSVGRADQEGSRLFLLQL